MAMKYRRTTDLLPSAALLLGMLSGCRAGAPASDAEKTSGGDIRQTDAGVDLITGVEYGRGIGYSFLRRTQASHAIKDTRPAVRGYLPLASARKIAYNWGKSTPGPAGFIIKIGGLA